MLKYAISLTIIALLSIATKNMYEVKELTNDIKKIEKGIDTVYICSQKNGNIYYKRTGNNPNNQIKFITK